MGTSQSGSDASGISARIATFYRDGSWIESRSIDQLNHVATWPGMRHVAAFPDLHPGRHGPVGAAFLSERLYPQLVGPDIGCGMALFKLTLPRRKLKLEKAIRRLACLDSPMDDIAASQALEDAGIEALSPWGLGTIGGGNHFCEMQEVSEVFATQSEEALLSAGDLCLLIHTGSRSLGAGIFNSLEARWNGGIDPDGVDGSAYLALHDQAVIWARLNRAMIANRVAEALRTEATLICDAPHNLVTRHEGLLLHRKGAAAPDMGLAPLAGSRDDASFLLAHRAGEPLTEGLGDPSLGSLSHGAGRRYDRSAMHGRVARTRSGLEAMSRNRFGGRIVCADRDLLIEEAGSAYKSAESVVGDLEAGGIASRLARMIPLLTWKTGTIKGDIR